MIHPGGIGVDDEVVTRGVFRVVVVEGQVGNARIGFEPHDAAATGYGTDLESLEPFAPSVIGGVDGGVSINQALTERRVDGMRTWALSGYRTPR